MRYVILMFLSNLALADSWLCTESSSEMHGSSLYACGVGVSTEKGLAAANAFKSARDEFLRVCESGTECGRHEFSVEPMRSSCDKSGEVWICHRLIVYRPQKAERHISGIFLAHDEVSGRLTNQQLLDKILAQGLNP